MEGERAFDRFNERNRGSARNLQQSQSSFVVWFAAKSECGN